MASGISIVKRYLPEVVPKKVYDIERSSAKKARKQRLQAERHEARARRQART